MKANAREDFERDLRKYQRLTLTLFYPPLLSLFACISGYFIANYEYFFAYASSRYFMIAFVESVRGQYSLLYFLPLIYSLCLAGLYVFLALQSTKGKLYPLVVGSVLYLADGIYGSLLYGTSLYGQMNLREYLLQLLIHVAFIVLYGFAIAKYAKLSQSLRKGNDL